MAKTSHRAPTHHLALRVREIAQLFNSMDPDPFLNKDLAREAETFIESWATGFNKKSRFDLTIHLAQWPADGDPTETLTGAIHHHFSYKAERTHDALKHLLHLGRISLAIGITFVSICLLAANAIGKLGTNPGYDIARESLTIIGWVAMWRPLQIFLYEWWPLQRQIDLYQRLSKARIHVIHGK